MILKEFTVKIFGSRFASKIVNIYHYSKWITISSQMKRIGSNAKVGHYVKIKGAEYIEIGDNFSAGDNLIIEAWNNYAERIYNPQIIIGNNVSFMRDVQISSIDKISIGDNTLIGPGTFISDNNHGDISINQANIPPLKRPLSSKGEIAIGKNVWIGRGCVILSGVTIGDGCIVGANSVVTKNIERYSVAAGVPAKIIRKLS